MARRRARDHVGICHICLREGPLTFEHVPPQAAFNDQRADVGGLEHWLSRNSDGPPLRVQIQQGGMGFHSLCADCNNRTGSWYASELTGWVHGAVAAIGHLPPIEEMDSQLEPHGATLQIQGVRPLAFVKQIATMVLAVNGPGFSERHSELRKFVLDRDRQGVPDGIQLYLALFLGPNGRRSGVQGRLDVEKGNTYLTSEIAHPPFAYLASFDEPAPLLPAGNVTDFGEVPYSSQSNLEVDLVVGFGHTIYPADFRTRAELERDREENARGRPSRNRDAFGRGRLLGLLERLVVNGGDVHLCIGAGRGSLPALAARPHNPCVRGPAYGRVGVDDYQPDSGSQTLIEVNLRGELRRIMEAEDPLPPGEAIGRVVWPGGGSVPLEGLTPDSPNAASDAVPCGR